MSFLEVEVANKHNGPWLFPAGGGRLLRGRWDYLNVSHGSVGEHHSVIQKVIREEGNFIPGLRIKINVEARNIIIEDPLRTTASGQKIWNGIRGAVQTINGSPMEPSEAEIIDVPVGPDGDNVIKTWLYWCAVGIETSQCIQTKESDKWPSSHEIDTQVKGGRTTSPYGASVGGRTDYGFKNNYKAKSNG